MSTTNTQQIAQEPLAERLTQFILTLRETYSGTPEQINSGLCGEFAEIVTVEFKEVALESGYAHTWVSLNGRHYDAEVPEGVEDWTRLPYYVRSPSCATPGQRRTNRPPAF